MSRAQRRARLDPPFVVVGTAALLLIAAATLSAAPPPPAAAAAACSSAPGSAVRAAMAAAPARSAQARVVERLGTRGQYLGRQVEISPAAGAALSIALPVESSVSQASPNLVVYTRVTNGRSEVRAIELATGCDYALAQPAGIVRSTLLDPYGTNLYVHSVTGTGRGDAGVVRYAVSGGPGTTVLPPLPADARYGQTFGTHLSWGANASALVVQSCGFEACRSRLLDVASGTFEMIDEVAHGSVIGVTNAHLVAYAACSWSPCDVVSIERDSGSSRVLARDALSAELVTTDSGAIVVQIRTTAGSMEVAP